MDLSTADMNVMAPQLRKPEGELGKIVAEFMAKNNDDVTAFTIGLLDVQRRDHVLEIGFGPGEGISQVVALTADGYVAGIDYSPLMLEMATDRNHRAVMQEHVELTLGEANALPYEDESFDKVFAVNVFHFWADPSKELAECRRVLKIGGRAAFFMSYPSSWRPGTRETGVFIDREPAAVEACLRQAGFARAWSKDITVKRDWMPEEFRGFATVGEKT
jgi:ubiquinone/menaquinone biosynthesis C-methylase UbiE